MLFLLVVSFLFSCAPMLCRIDQSVATNYLEDKAPKRYVSLISVSYGAIRIPFRLEKDGSQYRITGSRIPNVSFDKKGLCLNNVCLDLPFGPDGIIFGTVLTGEEKSSCSSKGIVLSRDVGSYTLKHYFVDNQLSKVEVLDRKREKLITLSYGSKTKEGYYKRVKVDVEDLSFTINVEEVSF